MVTDMLEDTCTNKTYIITNKVQHTSVLDAKLPINHVSHSSGTAILALIKMRGNCVIVSFVEHRALTTPKQNKTNSWNCENEVLSDDY